MRLHTRDINQAYRQSENTARTRYVHSYSTRNEPENWKSGKSDQTSIRYIRIGFFWYLKNVEHQLGKLNMLRSRVDQCLLYNQDEKQLNGFVIPRVDDSLVVGNPQFMRDEEMELAFLTSKKRNVIQEALLSLTAKIYRPNQSNAFTWSEQTIRKSF